MKKLIIIIIALCLGSCSQPEQNSDESDSDSISSTTKSMPEKIPDDFNFSVQFGVGKKNEINTFKGTVTKDLISDGTATTEIILTDLELNDIYEKMKEVNIIETKTFIPEPIDGMVCVQQPHGEDIWEIIIKGETIIYSFSEEYCEPTNDAEELMDLRNYVFDIIKSKDEYKELPPSKGGYD
ncbi:hypothetical protein CWR48_11535 [Oceanobacillus arenosus]|uniref:Uncharacterized protein n=1 Tax=Oceanobacillus arenosus TaxID=1229153 RepID=A0A3D8PR70_9BACI|nr:hypothetical protein [Oceanobacillus arenosus]RDW18212.1 hypothetical protein CWR48_11535 [Oceanobacillus arenosus]